jgi:hypothetical protein
MIDPEKTCGKTIPGSAKRELCKASCCAALLVKSRSLLQGSADAVGRTEVHLLQRGFFCSSALPS